jgi:hypothetical protein
MRSSIASSSPLPWLLPALALLAGGFFLRVLEPPLPVTGRGGQLPALAGQGGLPALIGGLRPALAGVFWLRANLAWERRDAPAMAAWLELTVAADESPAYFWLNGARMLAYDVPQWLPASAPAVVRRQVAEAQAQCALAFLDQGLRWRGADAALYAEQANIHLRRRGDLASAARCYRLAAESPGAPYYAARLHADLLVALGRPQEALVWLRSVLPGLPAADPAARRGAVQARIRALAGEVPEP